MDTFKLIPCKSVLFRAAEPAIFGGAGAVFKI